MSAGELLAALQAIEDAKQKAAQAEREREEAEQRVDAALAARGWQRVGILSYGNRAVYADRAGVHYSRQQVLSREGVA